MRIDQLYLALLVVLSAFLSPSALAEGEEEPVVAPTETTESDEDSEVITGGNSSEAAYPPAEAPGGSGSSGAGSSEATESVSEFSGGFFLDGIVAFPPECTDSMKRFAACMDSNFGNKDCAPCITSDAVAGLRADPPQLPSTCGEISDIMCHLATCCEPCTLYGTGVTNCFSIEGGTGPDGESCKIECGDSDTRSGARTTQPARVALATAAASFAWIVG